MTDFEERLRADLRATAQGRPRPAGLAERVGERIDKRQRRAGVQRVAAVAAALALAVVASGLALSSSGGDRVTSVADATPRTGAAGWATIAQAPIGPRFQHAAVQIGGDVLVFGGYTGSGAAPGAAIYDPESGRWRTVSSPPGDVRSALAVWTGSVVLALGNEGHLYAYDPAADTWQERARSPLEQTGNAVTSIVWTGEVLLGLAKFGGDESVGPQVPVSYDPETDEWATHDDHAAEVASFGEVMWTGEELLVAGSSPGSGRHVPALELRSYSPADGWQDLPTPPLVNPDRRWLGYAVWTGTELVVGGGVTTSDEADALNDDLVRENRSPTEEELAILSPQPALDAAAWNPRTATWRALPSSPVPTTGLDRYAEIWTGSEVVVWEAAEDGRPQGRLVLLDPAAGAWRLSEPSPAGHQQDAPATWTGHEIVIVSGEPTEGDTRPSECCGPTALALTFTP